MTSSNPPNPADTAANGGVRPNHPGDDAQQRLANAAAAAIAVHRTNGVVNFASSVATNDTSFQRFLAQGSLQTIATPSFSELTRVTIDGSTPMSDAVSGGESHQRSHSTPPVITTRGVSNPSLVSPGATDDGVAVVSRPHDAGVMQGNPTVGHSTVTTKSALFSDPDQIVPRQARTDPSLSRVAAAQSDSGLASSAQIRKAHAKLVGTMARTYDDVFGVGGIIDRLKREKDDNSGITAEEERSLHDLSYLFPSKTPIDTTPTASNLILTPEDDDLLSLSEQKEALVHAEAFTANLSDSVTPVPIVLSEGEEAVLFPPEVLTDVLNAVPGASREAMIKALTDVLAADVGRSDRLKHPDVIVRGPVTTPSDTSTVSQLSADLASATAEIQRLNAALSVARAASRGSNTTTAASATKTEDAPDEYEADSFLSVDPSEDIQSAPSRLMTGDHDADSMEGWSPSLQTPATWQDIESERPSSLDTDAALEAVRRLEMIHTLNNCLDSILKDRVYPKPSIELLGEKPFLQKDLNRLYTAWTTGDIRKAHDLHQQLLATRDHMCSKLLPPAPPASVPSTAAPAFPPWAPQPVPSPPSVPSSEQSSASVEGGGGGSGGGGSGGHPVNHSVGSNSASNPSGGYDDDGDSGDEDWDYVADAAGGGGGGPPNDPDDDDDDGPLLGRDCDVPRQYRRKPGQRGYTEEQAYLTKRFDLPYALPDASVGLKVRSEKKNKGNSSPETLIVDGFVEMMKKHEDFRKHLDRRDLKLSRLIPKRRSDDTLTLSRRQLRNIPLDVLFVDGLKSAVDVLVNWNGREKYDVLLYQKVTHSNHCELHPEDINSSHIVLKMLKRMWTDEFKKEVEQVMKKWGLTEASDEWGGITALYITVIITFRIRHHMRIALQDAVKSFSKIGMLKTPGEDVKVEGDRLKRLITVLYQCRALLPIHPDQLRKGFTLCSNKQFSERFYRLEHLSVEQLLQADREHECLELVANDQLELKNKCDEYIGSAQSLYEALVHQENGWVTEKGKDIRAFHVQTPSPSPNCDAEVPEGTACDNCGGPHYVTCCDKPRDKDREKKNREARLAKKKKEGGGKGSDKTSLPKRDESGNVQANKRAKSQDPRFNLTKNRVEQWCSKCDAYADHPTKYHEDSKKPNFNMLTRDPSHPFSQLVTRFNSVQASGASPPAPAPAAAPSAAPASAFAGSLSTAQLRAFHAESNNLVQEELKHGSDSVLGKAARTRREKLQSDLEEKVFRLGGM